MTDRLVGLVVKSSSSGAEDPGYESRWRRDFSWLHHTRDLIIGTPVATLPGTYTLHCICCITILLCMCCIAYVASHVLQYTCCITIVATHAHAHTCKQTSNFYSSTLLYLKYHCSCLLVVSVGILFAHATLLNTAAGMDTTIHRPVVTTV